jgi:hypothetical protein
MAADATNDAWLETCLISITAIGGNDQYYAGITENIDMDLGEKDIEQIVLTNGGRVCRWVPEGLSAVTMDMYPLEAGTTATTAAAAGTGVFDLLHAKDSSAPIRVVNTRARTKYRVLILWTNDTSITSAAATTSANKSALRVGLADGFFTSTKVSFTDGIVKFTVTYKTTAYDKSAASNVMMESCAGGAADVLPAIAAYTTSNKFG